METNLTSNHEDTGSIPGLWVKDQHCCELWCRLQMQLGSGIAVAAATAPIQPLAWEPPYAMEVAQEKAKRQKKKQKRKTKTKLVAGGGSQARRLISAVAASLHHSHSQSNSGSEPCLRPTPQLRATLDP